jgi:putative molybdopterin biosynthesis protein
MTSETVDPIRRIYYLEQIRILADPRRLEILRLLMLGSATVSQLGDILHEQPAQVRHHLKQLEQAGLVDLVKTRQVRGFVEKYYRARALAFIFQDIILPTGAETDTLTVMGSHDLALELLAQQLRRIRHNPLNLLPLPVGSLDGLIALRQGLTQMAGCHLLDFETGEYNLPYVRHLFPDQSIVLVTLAYREQGLLLAEGNPLGIKSVEDLAREDVTLINRNAGSGTRLWLERDLKRLGLSMQAVHGCDQVARTHTAVAETIAAGKADVGLGVQAVAHRHGLDYIPLYYERFDLALSTENLQHPSFQPLWDLMKSLQFRRMVEGLGGYQTAETGNILYP